MASNISISAVTIKAQEQSRALKSVTLAINDKEQRKLRWKSKGERTQEVTFESPIEVSPSDRLRFGLHRSYQLGLLKKQEEISFDAQDMLGASSSGKADWQHSANGTEITIQFSQIVSPRVPLASTSRRSQDAYSEHRSEDSTGRLTPTTEDIARICPRFRILLVGKTGVGKSSLINQAFGVEAAQVSDFKPGQADIDTEIISRDNSRFVLHDSQGFEPGELGNFQRVRDFVQKRNRMPELKDKLHAIWLCFATPIAGGRILETGVENLLKLKQDGSLGQVPIIVVLTKYDELIDREDRLVDESACNGLSDEEIAQLVKKNADAALRDCIMPLDKVIGGHILYTAVSTRDGYRNTLSELVQLTFDNVKDHVAKEASVVTAIAQKVNPNVKVDGSIEVGRARYWSGLAAGANFPGKRLDKCLEVIHTDIIAVWNFKDPGMNLRSKEFKGMMSNMVTDITVGKFKNPNAGLGVGFSVVATVAGVVSSLSGPAAPVVIPIAIGVVLAKWAYDVYQNSHKTLERIIAYIVDLTLVMQHMFCLMQEEDSVASRRIIKLAFKAYNESDLKSIAHNMISEHVSSINAIRPGAKDTTIEKIIEIIGLFRMDPAELSDMQSRIGNVSNRGRADEPWY